MNSRQAPSEAWPELPYGQWIDTFATLHLWTQIIGKVRLALTPWLNHSWHVALYVTARGLTTSPIPFDSRTCQIDFDFVDHTLRFATSEGGRAQWPLRAQSVADFYAAVLVTLEELGIKVKINQWANEIPDRIRLSEDRVHVSYDRDQAQRCWKVLVQTDRVLKHFRTGFIGKCSPVHFFWGSFDLAVTRFSGRRAPRHPGGVPNLPDNVAQEAYSHEVSSAGFWPGSALIDYPAFYSYAYPEPAGFSAAVIRPDAAFYSAELREFILPYEAVRRAAAPDEVLLAFLQSTYQAAANFGGWERAALECLLGKPGVPRAIQP